MVTTLPPLPLPKKEVKDEGGVGEHTHMCVCVCQDRHDGEDQKRETDIKSQLKSEPI